MLGLFKNKITNYIKNIVIEENKKLKTDNINEKQDINKFYSRSMATTENTNKVKDYIKYSFQKKIEDFVIANPQTGKEIKLAMDKAYDNLAKVCSGNVHSAPEIIYTFFSKFGFISWQLMSLLSQHWLISNACSLSNQDAIRNGWNNTYIETDNSNKASQEEKDKKQKLLTDLYSLQQKKYNINNILLKWAYQRNVYGISFLLPKIDGIDYEKPFNIDGVKKGSLKGFVVIEPYWLMPQFEQENMTDPASINFYQPTWYATSNGQKIHKSHFIIAKRKEVADTLKASYYFGGISLAQEIFERVYAAEKSANEAPLLLLTKRLNVYKIQDFADFFLQPEAFKQRLQQLAETRDNQGFLLCDKEDDVKQIDTALTDFDEAIKTQYGLVSAIARIPYDKLFEQNPTGGLSANGSYNVKNYNQDLNTTQTGVFEPAIDRINEIVLKSEFDTKDKIAIVFNPTDNPTEEEIANLNKTKADTTAIYLSNGVITPEEARTKLIEDKTSGYSFLKGIEFEEPSEQEQQEIEQMMKEQQGKAKDEDDITWITIKGNHIPIKEGQTKEEAVKEFLERVGEQNKIEGLNEPSKEDIYINVPYAEKEEAKAIGARWNPEKKSWYIPKGIHNVEFCKWYKEQAEDNGQLKEFNLVKPKEKEIVRKLADGFVATRETEKAYLIEKDGVDFWVQKRWVREDGTLTKAGEKSYNEALQIGGITNAREKVYEAEQEHIERLKKDGVNFQKVWENEKCVAADTIYNFYNQRTGDYEDYRVRIFIPKSILNEKGNAPYWLIKQKLEEAQLKADEYAGRHALGGYGNATLIDGFGDFFNIVVTRPGEDKAQDETNIKTPVLTIIAGKLYEILEKEGQAEDDASFENKHPRGEGGKFAKKELTKEEKKQIQTKQILKDFEQIKKSVPKEIADKMNAVNIDYTKDNILPEINKKEAEELGVEVLPIRLKKSSIEIHKSHHPEVDSKTENALLATALYAPDNTAAGKGKGYIHFAKHIGNNKNSLVLLDMEKTEDGFYDIVHYFFINDKNRKKVMNEK